jgi:hypothetical protein
MDNLCQFMIAHLRAIKISKIVEPRVPSKIYLRYPMLKVSLIKCS